MNNDIESLKRDYRDISAPPYLATRVRANVADASQHSRAWIPAAAMSLLLVLFWLLPAADRPHPSAPSATAAMSLSTLASLQPQKPPGAAPSLSKMHSVKVPQMPAKPSLKPSDQSTRLLENSLTEEHNHAFT
ncbi:MAG: hypothetical protein WBN23_12475 [Woeseia sp.]